IVCRPCRIRDLASLFAYQGGMYSWCFFFQAEDGIRDRNVTGVQTCALPIFAGLCMNVVHPIWEVEIHDWSLLTVIVLGFTIVFGTTLAFWMFIKSLEYLEAKETRSEERRVGKEDRKM